MNDDTIERQAELFKTLSCATRLKILLVLKDGDLSAGGIIDALAKRYPDTVTDRTNVSKHLNLLRGHGVISCTAKGKNRIYRLEASCLLDAMECTLRLADTGECPGDACKV